MIYGRSRYLRFLGVALVFGAFPFVRQAPAALYTFNFDTIVSGDPPGGFSIATMTIEDTVADSVLVTLNHNSTSLDGQFITGLWLNLDPFITPVQSAQTPINKFDGALQSGLDSQNNAGLNFDLFQGFQTNNDGGGVDRLKPGEAISFVLTGSGLDAADFLSTAVPTGGQRDDIAAMIFVQGLPNGGSVKLGSTDEEFPSVPEPASMGALALGIVALLRKARK